MSPVDVGRTMTRSEQARPMPADASRIVETIFGMRGNATRLDGEYDDNFLITSGDGRRHVLKIAPAEERQDLLELQLAAMERIASASPRVGVPRPVQSTSGSLLPSIDWGGERRFARADQNTGVP